MVAPLPEPAPATEEAKPRRKMERTPSNISFDNHVEVIGGAEQTTLPAEEVPARKLRKSHTMPEIGTPAGEKVPGEIARNLRRARTSKVALTKHAASAVRETLNVNSGLAASLRYDGVNPFISEPSGAADSDFGHARTEGFSSLSCKQSASQRFSQANSMPHRKGGPGIAAAELGAVLPVQSSEPSNTDLQPPGHIGELPDAKDPEKESGRQISEMSTTVPASDSIRSTKEITCAGSMLVQCGSQNEVSKTVPPESKECVQIGEEDNDGQPSQSAKTRKCCCRIS